MIGERVKKYREKQNMSLTELAERAGVAKSYISALERNIQKNPSVQFLEKVASELNITIDHLIKDDMDEDESSSGLDADWEELVREAMNSGVSKEEFKSFLEFNKWKLKNDD
ncbi:helix-turn-helix domain-containing protein [Tenuibacillus multivorans]|uniref:XRE family transcriptional regulator, master regulator for biofilm formation n=1 Tax=Tenuibacillus multivorans TaxID=237069 RepID=A0A1G9WWH8_9BACI|nr:helix-turn-helix domain-containing protein [Tenuibacillus multivorans]GEL78407.1 transcriptional regulator [Tenuibacillus multivorans]SDM88546.1 XRE family transcriptional regulator, master regulator for biofilm formation [Tenuibacillus multivorans]